MITERIDAITKISAAYLGTELPAPRSVKIELTATCDSLIIAHESERHPKNQGAAERSLRD